MSKKEILNKIINNIHDVSEFGNRFNINKQIPKIEIDLTLSKIRNLYDLLLEFDKLNIDSFKQNDDIPIVEEIAKKIKIESAEIENNNIDNKEVIDIVPDEVIKDKKPNLDVDLEIVERVEDEIIKPENTIIDHQENEEESISEAQSQDSEKIIADKFQSKKFIHDSISEGKNVNDISSKIQTKGIRDINSVIGMNDKFMFVRELFGGNKDEYIDTIQLLNNFDSFDNAYNFISEHSDWNMDDVNVNKLVEIVKRRYL